MPEYGDEIVPLVKLCRDMGVDYVQIKHCSDDEAGSLGIDHGKIKALKPVLETAEGYETDAFQVIVKWPKIMAGNERSYTRCLAPPFHLQISGSGLVAPCGMFFSPKYKKYHIGNLHKQRFYDLWCSDRYWEVLGFLASDEFNAKTQCGCLCLQDASNVYLNDLVSRGAKYVTAPEGPPPPHRNFL
jgi:hypothetical protein